MNGLDALALGIAQYEGPLRPPNRSYRNSSPGNLRKPGTPMDGQGYSIFPDFISGYEALYDDLESKFTDGKNTHGLGQSSTLAELFQIYAPTADQNDPASYASFIATWLSLSLGKQITTRSLLSDIWTPPTK